METTVAVVVVAVMVISLVSMVLAELYCTLSLRKRRHPNTDSPADGASRHPASIPSLRSFYAQGVIRTPRSFLFSEMQLFHNHRETASPESSTTAGDGDQLMYICNPMYDKIVITPFQTPPTSPPRLDIETGSCSGSGGSSPPLAPMEKIPTEGASVSLGDGPAIPSDSYTVDGGVTSSSSASTSTSPPW